MIANNGKDAKSCLHIEKLRTGEEGYGYCNHDAFLRNCLVLSALGIRTEFMSV